MINHLERPKSLCLGFFLVTMDDGGSRAELVTVFYSFSQESVISLHWRVRYYRPNDQLSLGSLLCRCSELKNRTELQKTVHKCSSQQN